MTGVCYVQQMSPQRFGYQSTRSPSSSHQHYAAICRAVSIYCSIAFLSLGHGGPNMAVNRPRPVTSAFGVMHFRHTAVSTVTGPSRLFASCRAIFSLISCGYFHLPQRPHSFWSSPALYCTSAHSCQARYPSGAWSPGLKSGVVQIIPLNPRPLSLVQVIPISAEPSNNSFQRTLRDEAAHRH